MKIIQKKFHHYFILIIIKELKREFTYAQGSYNKNIQSEIKDQNQFKKIQNNKTINNVNDKNQNGLKINKIIEKL